MDKLSGADQKSIFLISSRSYFISFASFETSSTLYKELVVVKKYLA